MSAPLNAVDCVCGEFADTRVLVRWPDAARVYRYCAECAEDVVFFMEGTEVLP